MRFIPVFLGLTLAFAATALVQAEPTFLGGKSSHGFLKGHESRGGKQCVAASSVRAESALGDDRLVLHANSRALISHLPAPCDGLMSVNSVGKLGLQAKDGKYCAGDSFTLGGEGLLSAVGLGGDRGPTRCTLGPFEGVSEMTLSEEFRR